MAHNVRHFFTSQVLLLAVFSSHVVQTLVSTSCVIFSSLNVGTHCVHVVAQLVNFSVQSLNVRRQLIDFSVAGATCQQSRTPGLPAPSTSLVAFIINTL
ncbi:Uncharacterised protein [Escherichia coli]|uniref:Uncharacterized protein n=1 Tax=Escherichia coli TaxID=562 RepID=A0A485JG12_ECOLX|nr:Uncharacterised protein [Escherichia coli]